MLDHNKMQQWMRAEIYQEHRLGPVTHFVIRHIGNGKLGAELLTINVPQPTEESWLTSATSNVEAQTELDAGGMGGGLQAYCILTYRGNDAERSSGRYTFRINSDDANDEEFLSSEPANGKGLVAQAMRHNEVLMRSSTIAIGQVVATQSRVIDRLATENEALHKQHAKIYEVLEELHSRKHERDLELRKAESREKMQGEIIDKVGLLAPALVNRMMGKKLLPEKTTPLVDSIKAFMTSLSEEQLDKVMTILSVEQKIALGSVVNSFSDDGTDPGLNGDKLQGH